MDIKKEKTGEIKIQLWNKSNRMTIHCDRKITENGEQEGKSPEWWEAF